MVDVRSLTLPAASLPTDLRLPNMGSWDGMKIMPFYLSIDFPGRHTTNWGIELYSNNQPQIPDPPGQTANELYRGLRGTVDPNDAVPLYWQVYPYDLQVWRTYGTPQSVTAVAGGLGFYPDTLRRHWGVIYDRSDVDSVQDWEENRDERVIASAERLGEFPQDNRPAAEPPVFLYIGGDLSSVENTQDFTGRLVLELFRYPFDHERGGYATPNPVKPLRGERVFFNFFTNQPDSPIKIRIYDPTGFLVRELENVRHWDCRNSRGVYVEGGLYLYQIEVEGHLISGTVVVIK